ncbi:P-loop containing nucleoside triphosphate hydrolase protein [Gongronella butleri]|nr:P-loop containing nucleoside triphosphate hydrolase protein [Gongronella butleri]
MASELNVMMDRPSYIRNVSVLGHLGCGKTTLVDLLAAKAGIVMLGRDGGPRAVHSELDEPCMSTVSTPSPLCHTLPAESGRDKPFLIHLIDTPGHVEFAAQARAGMHATDAALLVVDCLDGVSSSHTAAIMQEALRERLKPALFINKLDRVILDHQFKAEDIYQALVRTVASVNEMIAAHAASHLGKVQMRMEAGTVALGSGSDGWAFTLKDLARHYASIYNVSDEIMLERLWGDHFYDPTNKTWDTRAVDKQNGRALIRGFNLLVLGPIYKAYKDDGLCNMERNLEEMMAQMKMDDSSRNNEDRTGAELMSTLWPCAAPILDMLCTQLPSPVEAQAYRVGTLYTGPKKGYCYESMQRCDANGPLMAHIVKFVPRPSEGLNICAFARVYSGRVRSGQPIRLLPPRPTTDNLDAGAAELRRKIIGTVLLARNREDGRDNEKDNDGDDAYAMVAVTDLEDGCPAGNIVALTCRMEETHMITLWTTVTSSAMATPFRKLTSPENRLTVRAFVRAPPAYVRSSFDYAFAITRLRYPGVEALEDKTNYTHTILAPGENLLKRAITYLQASMAFIPLTKHAPVAMFREIVTGTATEKSANKQDSHQITVKPLDKGVCNTIERRQVPISSLHSLKHELQRAHGSKQHGMQILSYNNGFEMSRVNLLERKQPQQVNLEHDQCQLGFQKTCCHGPLANEPVYGCLFKVADVRVPGSSAGRGGNKGKKAASIVDVAAELAMLTNAATASEFHLAMHFAMMNASPTLQEAVYVAEMQCPARHVAVVKEILAQREAVIVTGNGGTTTRAIDGHTTLIAHIRASKSLSLVPSISTQTDGHVVPQLVIDHWHTMKGDIFQEGSEVNHQINELRRVKMMNPLSLPSKIHHQ